MPYIKQEERDYLQKYPFPQNAGQLNYCISGMVDNYLLQKGKNYQTLNELVGVLECAKLELYRRMAAPYEDIKMIENGDVYSDRTTSLRSEAEAGAKAA